MRHFIIAVAAVAVAALTAAAPASAQQSQLGGPIKQNGQCWKHHGVGADHMFGTMGSCGAQPASNTAARRPARQHS
jgi:opacity protein-like surface antigen